VRKRKDGMGRKGKDVGVGVGDGEKRMVCRRGVERGRRKKGGEETADKKVRGGGLVGSCRRRGDFGGGG